VVSQGELKTPTAPWVRRLPWIAVAAELEDPEDDDPLVASEKSKGKAKAAKQVKSKDQVTDKATGKSKKDQEKLKGKVKAELCEKSGATGAAPKRRRISGKTPDDASETNNYTFGILMESMLPFRQKKGTDFKEPGLPLAATPGAGPSDPVIAEWHDGMRTPIDDFTHDRLKAMNSTRKATEGCLYEAVKADNQHKLTLTQKVDRKLLLVMFEQNKHMLNFRVNSFGPVADESKRLDKDDVVLKAAVAAMKPIVDDYASGKVKDKAELQLIKKNLMQDLKAAGKCTKVGKEVGKRPAAASMASSSSSSAAAVPPLTEAAQLAEAIEYEEGEEEERVEDPEVPESITESESVDGIIEGPSFSVDEAVKIFLAM
jgi:hypothetical protein